MFRLRVGGVQSLELSRVWDAGIGGYRVHKAMVLLRGPASANAP